MYFLAFVTIYLLLLWRMKKGENFLEINRRNLLDFMLFSILGVIIGGRMGYVLYDFEYFWNNPLLIFSPYDFSQDVWIGIYGMSFHGGLLGVLLATLIFARKNKVNFWELADFAIPAIPAGYFFGRIGNFLNLELFGKKTNLFWGINFGDGILRHPTQIYEALSEGLILFLFLWFFRNSSKFKNKFIFIYLVGYAFFRVLIDFLREPDGIYGYVGFFSVSQFFTLVMLAIGIGGIILKNYCKDDRISG